MGLMVAMAAMFVCGLVIGLTINALRWHSNNVVMATAMRDALLRLGTTREAQAQAALLKILTHLERSL